jgi:uncharacterized Zn finger protein (UPF0148 family)
MIAEDDCEEAREHWGAGVTGRAGTKRCTFVGADGAKCGRKHYARGYCESHYDAVRRGRDPATVQIGGGRWPSRACGDDGQGYLCRKCDRCLSADDFRRKDGRVYCQCKACEEVALVARGTKSATPRVWERTPHNQKLRERRRWREEARELARMALTGLDVRGVGVEDVAALTALPVATIRGWSQRRGKIDRFEVERVTDLWVMSWVLGRNVRGIAVVSNLRRRLGEVAA